MNTEEKFILGALVGSALGAAAALIFTPMAGKNLRTKLMNGLSQGQPSPKRKSMSRSSAHVTHAKAKVHPAEHGHQTKKVRAKKKVSH